MRKLTVGFISIFLFTISLHSVALPVRHHFTGVVDGSSFGYEGKTVTGWYEYDFDNYDPNEPALYNFFNYSLSVGDLQIAEGNSREVTAYVNDAGGILQGFSILGETPFDQASGNGYNMDVFELIFGNLTDISEDYIPNPATFDLTQFTSGNFQIFGDADGLLPNQDFGVFWLQGSLTQVSASHTVPEPSSLMLFALGLMLVLHRITRVKHR